MAINIPIRKIINSASSVLKNIPGPLQPIAQTANALSQPKKSNPVAPIQGPVFGSLSATSPVTPKQQYVQSISNPSSSYVNSTSLPSSVSPNSSPFSSVAPTVNGMSGTSAPAISQIQAPSAYSTQSNSYKKAFDDYINSLGESSGLTTAKNTYADTLAERDKLLAGTEGQGRGIPLGLVRGQQEKETRLYAPELARLQSQIGIETDSQTAASAKAKARADFEKSLLDQYKPTEVGNSMVQFDPTTGKYTTVYTAPTKEEDFTLGEGQKRYDSKGNLIASGPEKQNTIKQSLVKVNGKDYLVDENGNLTEPQIPASTAQTSELKNKALTSAKGLLDTFTSSGGSAAVGEGRVMGGGLLSRIPGTKTKDFQIAFDNLKSLLSLDNVSLLKGQGAVSDAERQLLADASSKLNLAQSQTEFKKNLEDIVNALSGAGGIQSNSGGGQIIEYGGKQYQLDQNGNFDPSRPLTSAGSGANNAQKVSNPNKVVAGYDLSTYATDPNHVNGIKSALNRIGDVASFVKSVPSSPITPTMIYASANKYNVDPKLLTALLVQESSLGTKGRAVSTRNPGNVGNTDSGAKNIMPSWQAGVDAAAYQLARRKIA